MQMEFEQHGTSGIRNRNAICVSQINMPRSKTLKVGQSPPLNLCCSSDRHGCHIFCSQQCCCQHYYNAILDNPAVPAMTMWQYRSDGRHCFHSPPTPRHCQLHKNSQLVQIPQICLHDHTSTPAASVTNTVVIVGTTSTQKKKHLPTPPPAILRIFYAHFIQVSIDV